MNFMFHNCLQSDFHLMKFVRITFCHDLHPAYFIGCLLQIVCPWCLCSRLFWYACLASGEVHCCLSCKDLQSLFVIGNLMASLVENLICVKCCVTFDFLDLMSKICLDIDSYTEGLELLRCQVDIFELGELVELAVDNLKLALQLLKLPCFVYHPIHWNKDLYRNLLFDKFYLMLHVNHSIFDFIGIKF